MFFSLLILIAGLVMLVFAGEFLIKGSVGLSEKLGISPLVIGLTVVAFGTSAPELFISVQAALSGSPGIAIGNVVGSNIANALLVVGIPALFAPLAVTEPGLRRNMSVMLVFTLIFILMSTDGVIARLEGLVLLTTLAGFIYWQIHMARMKREPQTDYHEEIGQAPHDPMRIMLNLAGGLVGLPIGAQLTVMGASQIAKTFGVSDEAIGLSIVAVGTSLPELATTLVAVLRGNPAVAIGNVVGSNIFNLLSIMGVTAMIVPIAVTERIILVDNFVMLGTSILIAFMAFARMSVSRALGLTMLLAYASYIFSVF